LDINLQIILCLALMTRAQLLTTMGIANRAMNLMQRLVQEINIAEAFASANNKNLELVTKTKAAACAW
jgi:hypothetical protein